MGTISDFAQNYTKCASVGAMKNPQVSDQIPGSLDFIAFLNCKGPIHFCPC